VSGAVAVLVVVVVVVDVFQLVSSVVLHLSVNVLVIGQCSVLLTVH